MCKKRDGDKLNLLSQYKMAVKLDHKLSCATGDSGGDNSTPKITKLTYIVNSLLLLSAIWSLIRFSLFQSKKTFSNASSSLFTIDNQTLVNLTHCSRLQMMLTLSRILCINWWYNSLLPSSLKLLYPPVNLLLPNGVIPEILYKHDKVKTVC